ncbi:MAG: lipopolysaccharide biosynthesis protein [Actinomycetes bacterium]
MTKARASETLRMQVNRSMAWTALDVGVGRFAQFAMGVIVARIMAPQAFGVFAIALVVHAIIINVSELGVSAALIRDDVEDIAASAPTVSTIALGSSIVLGAFMAIGAPYFASMLGDASATGVIRVMALTLPLAGITAVPSALLRRDFRMNWIFVADLANTLATLLVLVPLALAGFGPMALAISWVAGNCLTAVILLAYKPGRYWPGWNQSEARRLLAFGLPLAGANIVTFSILNVDYVVVGRMLGAVSLGLYVLAFNISGWPMTVIGAIVRSVSLPGFSQLRRDGEALPEHFLMALRTVVWFSMPLCLILGALARPLVIVIYGEKWTLASAALIGLSVLGAARIVMELMADFLVAVGRTRAVFLAQLPGLFALTIALVIAVPRRGIFGAGFAQALVAVGFMIPVYVYFLRGCAISTRGIARAVVPSIAWAIAAGLGAYVVSQQFQRPILACLVGGLAGIAIYVFGNFSVIRGFISGVRRNRQTTNLDAIQSTFEEVSGLGLRTNVIELSEDPR